MIRKFKYSIVFVATLLSIIGIVFIVFFTSIKYNPIQGRYDNKKVVFTVLPQGWSFFTRNPREAQVLVYEIDKNNNLSLIPQKHSDFRNLFGLSRRGTVLISEAGLLRNKLKDTHFKNTKWNYQTNKFGDFPLSSFKLENEITNPQLCGEYLLVFQKPVPWAWSKNLHDIMMPAKVARINIICNE